MQTALEIFVAQVPTMSTSRPQCSQMEYRYTIQYAVCQLQREREYHCTVSRSMISEMNLPMTSDVGAWVVTVEPGEQVIEIRKTVLGKSIPPR